MSQLNNIVVVDVETSGVNPFKHSLLSVAFVPVDESLSSETIYVKPPVLEWTEFAKNNFKKFEADWEENATDPRDACDTIERYLKTIGGDEGVTLCGHNVGFDMAFLRQLAFWGDRDELRGLAHRTLDTHSLLYVLWLKGLVPASALSSDGAFEYFGIVVPTELRHTAEGDAKATRSLLLEILHEFDDEIAQIEASL